jgi:hypothetical protein
MTLASIVRQKLNETPPADKRHELSASDPSGAWTVYLTAERRDAWTTVAWELSVRRATGDGDVAAWAGRVAERSTGLLEALRVVEIDAANNQALVRSEPPFERDGKVSYYEVLLKGSSSALVRRYEGTHVSGKREQVAFALTNEVLSKWVGDLTAD